jgi:hypothetical protein
MAMPCSLSRVREVGIIGDHAAAAVATATAAAGHEVVAGRIGEL